MSLLFNFLNKRFLNISDNKRYENKNLMEQQKALNQRKLIMFSVLVFSCVACVWAQSEMGQIARLDEWGKIILGLFTSTWLKAVCVISLIGLCLGLVTIGRNEPGLAKKFIPWLIGVVGILSAASIVNFFFKDTSGLTGIQ